MGIGAKFYNKSILSSKKYLPGINFVQLESLYLNANIKQMILQDTKINDLKRQLPKIYLWAGLHSKISKIF